MSINKSISENHEFLLYNKGRHTMSLHTLLERLAEYFPKENYEARLERYINSHNPKSCAELEQLVHRFEIKEAGGQRL